MQIGGHRKKTSARVFEGLPASGRGGGVLDVFHFGYKTCSRLVRTIADPAECRDVLLGLDGPIAVRDDATVWPSEKEMQTRVSHWPRDQERAGHVGVPRAARDYLRALAQRVEVDAQELRIIGSEKRTAAHARRRFKLKNGGFWRAQFCTEMARHGRRR